MIKRTARFGIALLATMAISEAIAQPDYCTNLKPEALYISMPCTGNSSTQCPVPAEEAKLKRNVSYKFFYKTWPTEIRNSLIVVKLKAVAAQPVATPVSVRVSRQRLPFACHIRFLSFSKFDVVEKGPYPDYNDSAAASNDPPYKEAPNEAVPYKDYDRFHRYGTPVPSLAILSQIHTNYNNGSECVSTLERVRRAQFLFADQDRLPGFLVALGTNIGIREPTAIAAEINHYDHLQVIVANYQKQPQSSGCISFVGRSYGPALEVDLSDLEEKVHTSMPAAQFTPRTWIITAE